MNGNQNVDDEDIDGINDNIGNKSEDIDDDDIADEIDDKVISGNLNLNLDALKVAADPQDITPEQRKINVKKLAGAISHALRTNGEIDVRSLGNASINKAVKALAIAKKNIAETHQLKLSYSPAFITPNVGDKAFTGICFCTFCFEDEAPEIIEQDCKIVLKVKADQKDVSSEERRVNVRKLAGAISNAIKQEGKCAIRCFGYSSIGKACKALAIARGFVACCGSDLYAHNGFIMSNMGKNERTGTVFIAYSNGK